MSSVPSRFLWQPQILKCHENKSSLNQGMHPHFSFEGSNETSWILLQSSSKGIFTRNTNAEITLSPWVGPQRAQDRGCYLFKYLSSFHNKLTLNFQLTNWVTTKKDSFSGTMCWPVGSLEYKWKWQVSASANILWKMFVFTFDPFSPFLSLSCCLEHKCCYFRQDAKGHPRDERT